MRDNVIGFSLGKESIALRRADRETA